VKYKLAVFFSQREFNFIHKLERRRILAYEFHFNIIYIALCGDLLGCWVGTKCLGVDFGFWTNKFESHSFNGVMPPSTYGYVEIIIMLYGYFGTLEMCLCGCFVINTVR
jgi:hypothetical protein